MMTTEEQIGALSTAVLNTEERRKLIAEYGFPNEAAFLNYLEHYQGGQATQR